MRTKGRRWKQLAHVPAVHRLGETLSRDRHCLWDRFVRLIGQQQAKDKLGEAGFDWLTQILAGAGSGQRRVGQRQPCA